jgi:hypothetical protein
MNSPEKFINSRSHKPLKPGFKLLLGKEIRYPHV